MPNEIETIAILDSVRFIHLPPDRRTEICDALKTAMQALREKQEREKEPHGLLTAWETPESCPHCMEHLSLDWSYCPQCGRPTDWAPNEPLTLDELKQINGEPVYVVQELGGSEWLFRRDGGFIDMYGDFTDDDEISFDTYGLLWVAYPFKPKEEREDG